MGSSYKPSFLFNLANVPNVLSQDFEFNLNSDPWLPDTFVRVGTNFKTDKSVGVSGVYTLGFKEATPVCIGVSAPFKPSATRDSVSSLFYDLSSGLTISGSALVVNNDFNKINVTHTLKYRNILPFVDVGIINIVPNDFKIIDTSSVSNYFALLPYVDVGKIAIFNMVRRFAPDKVIINHQYAPIADTHFKSNTPYIPDVDFINPLFQLTSGVMSPVDTVLTQTRNTPDLVDVSRDLTYGYSLNRFLVGGVVVAGNNIDDDVVNPPIPPVISPEVVQIVNIINVVVLPERTPIQFANLTMSTDLDSIAWVFNFDVADQASVALMKPQGLTVKFVEIDINGDKFEAFIGRTSTAIAADPSTGKVTRRTKCVGWSAVKQLSYPYSAKRSHVETSGSTPAGILSSELTGTGFTGTWGSVSWTLPAGVFGYVERAPLAAISELAQSVGAVVIADKLGKSFSVKPRYPISPWSWSTATPDLILNEAQFFSIDTEWIPAESPDSVYVYGEEKGVGVKCVKQGTAGLKTLPTVVDKHITDTIAGTERGRVEVAKNGFKEIVPVSTYVDGTGIILPQTLIQVNALDASVWYGMVVGVTISLKRNGNALIQQLQIERHYD